MKNRLMPLMDRVLVPKRPLIETINGQLKNISQITHTRHSSACNFWVNLLAGLIAYTRQPDKSAPNLSIFYLYFTRITRFWMDKNLTKCLSCDNLVQNKEIIHSVKPFIIQVIILSAAVGESICILNNNCPKDEYLKF